MRLETAIFLLSALLAPARALALEHPLPELIGPYQDPFESRSVDVRLDVLVPSITGLSMQLSGAIHPGWAIAEGDTFAWGGAFGASLEEPDPGFWLAYTTFDLEGEFRTTIVFRPLFGASGDFLADGESELRFQFAPHAFTGNVEEAGPPPSASISSAVLVIEGPVPVRPATWSSVKALYQ